MWPPVPQAREREQESEKRLSLLEERLSVKEKTLTLMEVDLEKVRKLAPLSVEVEVKVHRKARDREMHR